MRYHRGVRRLVASLATAAILSGSAPALAAPPLPSADPWFGRDKALHFTLSAAIAGTAYGFTSLISNDMRVRIAFGGGVALAAGAGKELLDLAGYGDPSWRDFAWDVIGTVIGVGISVSIDLAVRGLHPGQAYGH